MLKLIGNIMHNTNLELSTIICIVIVMTLQILKLFLLVPHNIACLLPVQTNTEHSVLSQSSKKQVNIFTPRLSKLGKCSILQ